MRILSGLRIVLDDVIDGTVEDHAPRRVTGDTLGLESWWPSISAPLTLKWNFLGPLGIPHNPTY